MDLERLEVGSTPSKPKGRVYISKKGSSNGKSGYAAPGKPGNHQTAWGNLTGLTATTTCKPLLVQKA